MLVADVLTKRNENLLKKKEFIDGLIEECLTVPGMYNASRLSNLTAQATAIQNQIDRNESAIAEEKTKHRSLNQDVDVTSITGNALRGIRKLSGVTVQDIATRLGINRQSVYYYENVDNSNIDLVILAAYANACGCKVNVTVTYDDKTYTIS